ncbi:DDE superfamily endonuclease [Nitrosomonas communis]|uniref:DDE superfamily endonuclease n=1 Tax=Nitrosomonas communis TaxID=44574 RepID=A0A1H3AH69_9PROT|nr:transposase [Nitrosomonas communis]SDX29042.1 DDE superfamily endonuclease [Nitrosomonas communis]
MAILLTVSLFAVNISADVFHGWAMQDLLPKLPSHAVVVMDNATFHKRQDTRDAIQNAGYTLEYLPAYSPDLNPIEHKCELRAEIEASSSITLNY